MATSNRYVQVIITATTGTFPEDSADGDWLIQFVTGTTSGSVVYDAWSAITSCMYATGKTGENNFVITIQTGSTATAYCCVLALRPFGRATLRSSTLTVLRLLSGNNVKTYTCMYAIDRSVLLTRGMIEYFADNFGNPSAFTTNNLQPAAWERERYTSTELQLRSSHASPHTVLHSFNVWNGTKFLGPVLYPEGSPIRLWPAWNFKMIVPPSDNVEYTDSTQVTTFSFDSSTANKFVICGAQVFPNQSDIVYVTSAEVGLYGGAMGRPMLSTGTISPPKQIKQFLCNAQDATLYSASTVNSFVKIEVQCYGSCLSETSTMSVTDSNNVINGGIWQNIPYDVEDGRFYDQASVVNTQYLNVGYLTVTIDP